MYREQVWLIRKKNTFFSYCMKLQNQIFGVELQWRPLQNWCQSCPMGHVLGSLVLQQNIISIITLRSKLTLHCGSLVLLSLHKCIWKHTEHYNAISLSIWYVALSGKPLHKFCESCTLGQKMPVSFSIRIIIKIKIFEIKTWVAIFFY
jgi:hypothetical protein